MALSRKGTFPLFLKTREETKNLCDGVKEHDNKTLYRMTAPLKKLFYHNRFGNFHGLSALLFMLYVPCGLVLFIFRSLVSIQFLLLMIMLPKRFFLRRFLLWFYFAVMGMFISIGGAKHKKEKVSMIISNHVSYLDSLAMEAVVSSWRLQDHTKVPSWFAWLFGFKNPEVRWMEDVKTLEDNVADFPFAFFPEEETTNSKVGLLKFSTSPFKLILGDVQPIVILIHRPWFLPIHPNYTLSTFWSDLFWFLFVPVTMMHVSYLPVVRIEDDENELDEFVNALHKDMSYVLGIEASNHTGHDKKEYIKRMLHEERMSTVVSSVTEFDIKQEQIITSSAYRNVDNNRTSTRTSSRHADNFNRMVDQVKSVLPQVPVDVIKEIIERTKDVDSTITHLLEGSIDYTPLTEEEQEKEKKMIKEQPVKVIPKPQVFANSYKDRHLSFQERKARMIEEARNKYLEVHPEYR